MKITKLHSDETILSEIGQRLARRRLDLQLTQADIAKQAGVSKRSVERLESGATVKMSIFIRILRVLNLLPGLDNILPQEASSPMDLLKLKGKTRQRASTSNAESVSDKTWAWGDES